MTEEPCPEPDSPRRPEISEPARRGRLKIFFGFAPGVGKTYRLLQVARELMAQGTDVVVGAVETHGRYETAALLLGLEMLAPHPARDHGLGELDLDEALARLPAVLVLDELAHHNAAGARHAKRWQDVLELLDAGIDVYSTLNVQHLESLGDVVEQITEARVAETVPDSILEQAAEVELVDVAPEELLLRLRQDHPKRPPLERGTLLALRELALRRIAERVDAEVRAYRDEHGVASVWPTGERVLVCVGPAPASERLIRAGRRLAAGLRAPWIAAYVDTPARAPLRQEDRARLEAHLRLAESLGATVVRLTGARAAQAILEHARRHNVSRIVLGKPTHARLRDRLGGSLLDDIVRGSGHIELHVISGVAAPGAPLPFRGRPATPPSRYIWAALFVALASGLAAGLRLLMPLADLEMLYLLVVMVSAVYLGRGPSLLAAALGVAAYDFFFVAPRFTFAVGETRHMLTFAMMFGVGLVVSSLAARIRRHEKEAQAREERTRTLYGLTHELGAAKGEREIAAVACQNAAGVFAPQAWVLKTPEGKDGQPRELAAYPLVGTVLTGDEREVARWALEHDDAAGAGTDTFDKSTVVAVPLLVGARALAVLVLRVAGAALDVEQRTFLESFARQVALALSRVDLDERARQADLRARAEEMRSSLLSAVSHDLRTPLAAITGAATTVRANPGLPGETRDEMLATICEESERLERLVGNLVDMTRLDSGAVSLKRDWLPIDDVVGSALTRLETTLGSRPVDVKVASDLPLVWVDPVLLEQLLVNLLENAVKHTPGGTAIAISAAVTDAALELEVADGGRGIPAGDEERIFERFYRRSEAAGVGLGLAICRAIARAHGGTLSAGNRPAGGAVFRLVVPVEGTPPSRAAAVSG